MREKREIAGYEICTSVMIGGHELVFGINPDSPQPYYAGKSKRGPFGDEFVGQCGEDYLHMLTVYADGIAYELMQLKREVGTLSLVTADQVEQITPGAILDNMVVAMDPAELGLPYRTAENQLYIVSVSPDPQGDPKKAYFAANLYTGQTEKLYRNELLGTVRPEHLPEWAKSKQREYLRRREAKSRPRPEPER